MLNTALPVVEIRSTPLADNRNYSKHELVVNGFVLREQLSVFGREDIRSAFQFDANRLKFTAPRGALELALALLPVPATADVSIARMQPTPAQQQQACAAPYPRIRSRRDGAAWNAVAHAADGRPVASASGSTDADARTKAATAFDRWAHPYAGADALGMQPTPCQQQQANAAPAQSAAHTPGPWEEMMGDVCAPNGRTLIGEGAIGGETDEEAHANLLLVTATPMLLAALEKIGSSARIVAALPSCGERDTLLAIVAMCDAAIALTRGRA